MLCKRSVSSINMSTASTCFSMGRKGRFAVRSMLSPATLLGCTAESVLAGHREVEGAAAVALWAGHTGPVSPFQYEFSHLLQVLAAHGYLVVVANPREPFDVSYPRWGRSAFARPGPTRPHVSRRFRRVPVIARRNSSARIHAT